ncbi:hypothetical protein B0H15DRAFT_1017352 [Mycena belliarum]|uniref:DNA-binding protein RAP1 n=1 Tax=Mycena belliarum TaxID=1033014 RepID=A0AAD6XYL1_9AGAR|nr:hypothetical protein B0H15DRAFT_1017352 [Mycena belliae]
MVKTGTTQHSYTTRGPIFQDADTLTAVKFFIQKDIAQDIQAELCETITSLGGRVETKVPRQGYILVQSGTAEEERLRLCWSSPDRPERYFVPYTYVEACKIAGMLLKQIFVDKSAPIAMHIHPSIANVNARNALSQRIMHSGGDPHASAQSARVILADPNTDVFQHLIKVFQGQPDKYVESYLWVKKCVERGAVLYTPVVYKNPGGRRPGEERTQFTEEDEQNLANWIATKIPYKETGGRTGNRLYQQLCELNADPDYAWVARHTWQSWRERYKKNAVRLDALISTIVAQKKPLPGEKGQYGYVRQAEEKQKKTRKKKSKNEVPYLDDDEFLVGSSKLEGMGVFSGDVSIQGLAEMPMTAPGVMPQLPGIMFDGAPRAGPSMANPREAEEEMDEEGSEWRVRVGNSPPPMWGGGAQKRRAHDDGNDETRTKRPRPEEVVPSAPVVGPPDMHVLDQAIREIANDFRFTVDEVQAFYDRCGEMGRTRTRFQEMRELLALRFPDEE